MFTVNLIPMRRREQRKLRARRNAWIIAACGYVIILGAGYGVWHAVWGAGDRDLSRQLTLVNGDTDEASKALARLRAELSDAKLALQVNETIASQPDWSVLLALLAKLRGDEIVLNHCAMVSSVEKMAAADKPVEKPPAKPQTESVPVLPALGLEVPNHIVVSVRGYGRSQAAVQQFVLRLEQCGLFDTVAMLGTTREGFASVDAVAFRLECSLRTRPAGLTATATTGGGGQ